MDTHRNRAGAPAELADSHAHLDMEEFDRDREDVLIRARETGVAFLLCPADLTQERSLQIILGLASGWRHIRAAAGVHPHQACLFSQAHADRLRALAAAGRIAALGEIGLDFHYNLSSPKDQVAAFRAQLALAGETGLPAIIHSRLSGAQVVDALRETKPLAGGVLHCFTEDWDVARNVIEAGFFISFSGILTFPKAEDLRATARKVPLDRLLVETDSPYLAPVPHRGQKRNEPAFLVETARVLAGLRGLSLEELARATTENFHRLFPPPAPESAPR